MADYHLKYPHPHERRSSKPRIQVPEDYPFPKQKIVVAVRALNEQDNVGRFCNAYSFATKICIADGGSTDKTLDLARQFENVEISRFPRIQYLPNGMPFNVEGAHSDFAISFAKQHNPDWLIFDDMDVVGTPLLNSWARFLLKNHPYPVAFVRYLFLWHDGKSHFPDMDRGNKLWAWKPKEIDIHADTSSVLHPKLLGVPCEKQNEWAIDRNAFALLHHCWNSEETVVRKMAFYSAQGRSELHPLQRCGRLEPIPIWARD